MKIKVVNKGRKGESAFCRQCSFSLCDIKSGCLSRAKYHTQKTGHAVDVYYETWRLVADSSKLRRVYKS